MELRNEIFSRENQSGDRTKPLRRSPALSVEGCLSGIANEGCVSSNRLSVVEVQNFINQLYHCLHHRIGESNTRDPSSVTIETLYRWCEQIASGMEYLTMKQVTISMAIHKWNGNDFGRGIIDNFLDRPRWPCCSKHSGVPGSRGEDIRFWNVYKPLWRHFT